VNAASFERCSDITETDIVGAVSSAEAFRSFLDRAATVGMPEEGAPKVLLAIARLATPQCTWLEGELRVGIEGNEQQSRVAILVATGGQPPRRVAPVMHLRVPLDEFTRAVRLAPRLIEPLKVLENGPRIVLGTVEAVVKISQRPSSRPTRQQMIAVPPEAKRSTPHMAAVVPDIHSKPTRVRMEAVRIEDASEAQREQADIDDLWDRDPE